MYKNTAIKNVIAVLMLCIFVFSITPKQWLHDVITNHHDSRSNSTDDKQSVSTSGFHCKCDNLVVQSPFINYEGLEVINLPEVFVLYQTEIEGKFISAYHFFSSLRGPPSLI